LGYIHAAYNMSLLQTVLSWVVMSVIFFTSYSYKGKPKPQIK
jgi:hypothetical protein